MKTRTIAAAALTVVLAACSLPTVTLVTVGREQAFRVEVAETEQAQRDGLSGRSSLPEGTGMLFVFEDRRERQVWMAGMEIPIDIAWIAGGEVIATDTLQPCVLVDQRQCPRWASPEPVDALLEVGAGDLEGVERGDRVTW